MLFNSIEFAIFLPIVFLLYWFLSSKTLTHQNLLLVVASFIFYGWWDWRFLLLLVFSSGIDFVSSIYIEKAESKKKKRIFFLMSVITNIGILAIFKYFNFFVTSFASAFRFFGHEMDPVTLKVVLPVGVSFYTFQALSYTIEVYRGKLKPTYNILTYFAFISFFPQLVAGPIERATNMLPQFYKKRVFDRAYATDGMRQVLWGLFKKVVIADNCSTIVNSIYHDYSHASGNMLVIGALLFSFQIYADFSGYSDIAIGTARLFGFKLMRNFAFPYFSRDIAEFWRRWHISLSSWFRDYVYIPLGGSKGSKWFSVRNIFIIFLLSGLWHGANWTFIAWGFINACYFLPLMLLNYNRVNTGTVAEGKALPGIKEFFQMLLTFAIVTLAWIFFRAANIHEALHYIARMFRTGFLLHPSQIGAFLKELFSYTVIYFIFFLLGVEWVQRNKQHGLEFTSANRTFRWAAYLIVTAIIIFVGAYASGPQEFIYFQF